jgi:hypothetical protein
VACDVQEENPPNLVEIGGHASKGRGRAARWRSPWRLSGRPTIARGDRRERGDLTQDDADEATSTFFTTPETSVEIPLSPTLTYGSSVTWTPVAYQ